MGLFDGLDIASAPEVGIPDGVYNGEIGDFEKQPSKKGDPYLVVKYKVRGQQIQEWLAIPVGTPATWDNTLKDNNDMTEYDRNMRSLGYIKRRLESFGVPADRMNTVGKEHLVGLKVVVTVKKNRDGFPSITDVALPGASGTTLPVASPSVTTQPAVSPSAPVVAPTVAGGPVSNPFAPAQ